MANEKDMKLQEVLKTQKQSAEDQKKSTDKINALNNIIQKMKTQMSEQQSKIQSFEKQAVD